MSKKKAIKATDAFQAILREALENFHDPVWLSQHSPLATPYFLGKQLRQQSTIEKPVERGQVLQTVLREAAADLWPGKLPHTREELKEIVNRERNQQGNKGPHYLFYLLELRYFRQYFHPRRPPTTDEILNLVNVSQTRFFIHLEQAIDELGKLLLKHIQPTLRLEQPTLNPQMIGRDNVLAKCLYDLQQNRSVALSGVGGVGKTALGTAVSHDWSSSAVFWFTVRPGLNDDLHSLLFAIGHFLNGWGHSTLWLQLIANEGKQTNVEQAIGFLRDDLHTLSSISPLFCFDEVDLLQTSEQEPRQAAHAPLLEFLESLRGLVPLLLMGQRAFIDTNTHYPLLGLTLENSKTLLQQAGVQLNNRQIQHLYTYTKGNPRLLELYIALYQSSEESPLSMPKEPSVTPLFFRLWKRLDEYERRLLSILAVFRSVAPDDLWQNEQTALDSLVKRNLVKRDLVGGVILIPLFRDLVYNELLAEQREELHYRAAMIRAERGEYTSAAYHFWKANDFAAATQVWAPHQDLEIQRGQAEAARQIFSHISPNLLEGQLQSELVKLQNRLDLLAGAFEQIQARMSAYGKGLNDEEVAADAYRLWGRANAGQGHLESALERYEESIAKLARLSTKIVRTHFLGAQAYITQANTGDAFREAKLALLETELIQGLTEFVASHFDKALSHFERALTLGEELKNEAKVAQAHYWLAATHGKQAKIEIARIHAEGAMAYYEKVGNRLELEGMRAQLGGLYIQVGQFENVIAPSQQALQFFENIKHDPWCAAISNNLAESYFELGQIDKAKHYANQVLRLESVRSIPYALYTLGLVYEKEKAITDAETTFSRGVQIAQENEDLFVEAYLHRALGCLYLTQHRYEEAGTSLETSLQMFIQMKLEREVAKTEAFLRQLPVARMEPQEMV